MEFAITKDLIDHEVINKALEEKELFIVPAGNKWDYLLSVFVTKFEPIKRKRKDGKQRYDAWTTSSDNASHCYCHEPCSCGGDIQTYDDLIQNLTAEEIAQQFYFYPRLVAKIRS